jgi:hypothetical protein
MQRPSKESESACAGIGSYSWPWHGARVGCVVPLSGQAAAATRPPSLDAVSLLSLFFSTPACAPPLIGHPCTLPPPLHPHFALGRLQWYVTDRLTGRPTDGQSTRNPLIVRRQCCTHREGHECPSCFLQRLSCNEASRQHTCTAPSSRTWPKPTRLPWPKTARVVFQ